MFSYEFIKRIFDGFYSHVFRILFKNNFKKFGNQVKILRPLKIEGAKFISIRDSVCIQDKAWLLALKQEAGDPIIDIGEGTYIGHFVHIVSINAVIIGNKVLIADQVYIADNLHSFGDPIVPIIDQPVMFKGKVEIGDHSWIGENVCIIGATIGKHCVIGANSVVTKDIPDYSVAVGSPARIIKRYSFTTKQWERVTEA